MAITFEAQNIIESLCPPEPTFGVTILDFGFSILACKVIGSLDLLWLKHWAVLLTRSA
jgi:hypothetical protein